jgi:outer membrane protein assembly factor BamA
MKNLHKTKLHVIFLISCLTITAIPITIQAQEQNFPIISDIVVEGHKITKEYVIRREIHHPVNVPYDSVLAEEDRNRIDNLGIFSTVEVMLLPDKEGAQILSYKVVESWRIFPGPIIMYEEESGWSFGGILVLKNFRGRNEDLSVYATFGRKEVGGFGFNDPWIMGDHVSFRGHMYYNLSDHLFLPHEYRELDLETTIGRYFGYQWKVWGTVSVEKRWIDFFSEVEQDVEHQYFQTKFQLIYDTRNIYQDPSEGIYIDTQLRPEFGLNDDSPNITELYFTARAYKLLIPGKKKWVAGLSLSFHNYYGESIPYKTLSVGGAESVRGWEVLDSTLYAGESFRSGLNTYFFSAELRQTLIPKRLTSFGTEFGLILAEFFDVGAADDNFSHMISEDPIIGTGIGLRFFIPGNMLFRVDYGIGYHDNEWRIPQWHISVGHKF